MPDLTRRGVIGRTSAGLGAVALGGLAVNGALGAAATSAPESLSSATVLTSPRALTGPMVVHIRDVARAEMSLMVGTQEFVYQDSQLVGRLVEAARAAAAGRARGA